MAQQPNLGVGRSLVITHRHTTLDMTPLYQGSARRRYLYLHNTKCSQQTDIHGPVGFEPAIPGSDWPQTYALDGAATVPHQRTMPCSCHHMPTVTCPGTSCLADQSCTVLRNTSQILTFQETTKINTFLSLAVRA